VSATPPPATQPPTEGFRQTRYAAPPTATTVILVRHGESAAARLDEPFPLRDGHGDPALHPEGERQAVKVGERLRHERIDAIYVTTLQRTH
jgi:2,3-bisphosphoglycerate-dependent phosphoglycerate mutase